MTASTYSPAVRALSILVGSCLLAVAIIPIKLARRRANRRPLPGSPEEDAVMRAALPLIRRLVRSYAAVPDHYWMRQHVDEIVSAVALHVLERAVRTWVPGRSSLGSWIAGKARLGIRDWARNNRSPELCIRLPRRSVGEVKAGRGLPAVFLAPTMHLSEPCLGESDDGHRDEMPVVEDRRETERGQRAREFAYVLALISHLSARERELIVRFHDLDGKGHDDLNVIARDMNIHESRACQIRVEAEMALASDPRVRAFLRQMGVK